MMRPGHVRCGNAMPLSKSDERCLRRGISFRAGDSGRIALRALGAMFQKNESMTSAVERQLNVFSACVWNVPGPAPAQESPGEHLESLVTFVSVSHVQVGLKD